MTGCTTAFLATTLTGLLGLQSPEGRPPGHPPMPPGHPPLEATPQPAADEADVESIDAIVSAYYDSISGPAGEPRDWERFRSLFLPDARFITPRPDGAEAPPISLDPQQFVRLNRRYFERGGYYEREVHRRTDVFGRIAHAFSTYESRRDPDDAPYARGINSMELFRGGGRWWIVTVMWERERASEPIPPEYLPGTP